MKVMIRWGSDGSQLQAINEFKKENTENKTKNQKPKQKPKGREL